MNSDAGDPCDEPTIDDASPEQQLEYLYRCPLSVLSLLISATQTFALVAFVSLTPLYGLTAIGAFGVEYFPDLVQQSTRESGLHVLVRLLYLVGPLIGVVSIGVFLFVSTLERILRLKRVVRKVEESGNGDSIREILSLMQKQTSLGDKVTNWQLGDPAYDAYLESGMELKRKKRQLVGPLPATLVTRLVLVVVNWYALGLQFYYGLQWGFFSKWLAIPVLAVWFAVLAFCTISMFRSGDGRQRSRLQTDNTEPSVSQ